MNHALPGDACVTSLITDLMDDEEYRQLQIALSLQPELGPVIPGTHALRKVRWRARGRGKRGGVRVIYAWEPRTTRFFMLYAFAKNERSDLIEAQRRVLNRVVDEEFG